VLRPVRPNAGLEACYRKRLRRLVEQMTRSVLYWVRAAYRANEPELAQDANAATELRRALRKLTARWQSRFDEASEEMAEWFAQSASARSDASMRRILRNGGLSVRTRHTPAQREVMGAIVAENVALIKSIPQRYLGAVEGSVMRSVQTGRDLSALTKELQKEHGVTSRRAALIARDQNNKATAALHRVRQTELGITEAIWLHSGGGKHPRPTHKRNSGKRYNVAEGWYDPEVKRNVFPGELINCFPGQSKIQFARNIEVAYRRFYTGELAFLVTESGKTLRATPNHPVLTKRGWVPISLVDVGDYITEIASDTIIPAVAESYVDNTVPSLVEIFDSLARTGKVRPRSSLGYFHGDAVCDSNVDVVDAARPLSFDSFELLRKSRENQIFTGSNYPRLAHSFVSKLFTRGFFATARFVGFSGNFFAPFRTFFLHPQLVGFSERSSGSSCSQDTIKNRSSVDLKFFGESRETNPLFILPTKHSRVTHVDVTTFDGHVYNLQTSDGWYVTGGIITHNCRCVSRSVIPGL
jgi:hypothetical protein